MTWPQHPQVRSSHREGCASISSEVIWALSRLAARGWQVRDGVDPHDLIVTETGHGLVPLWPSDFCRWWTDRPAAPVLAPGQPGSPCRWHEPAVTSRPRRSGVGVAVSGCHGTWGSPDQPRTCRRPRCHPALLSDRHRPRRPGPPRTPGAAPTSPQALGSALDPAVPGRLRPRTRPGRHPPDPLQPAPEADPEPDTWKRVTDQQLRPASGKRFRCSTGAGPRRRRTPGRPSRRELSVIPARRAARSGSVRRAGRRRARPRPTRR